MPRPVVKDIILAIVDAKEKLEDALIGLRSGDDSPASEAATVAALDAYMTLQTIMLDHEQWQSTNKMKFEEQVLADQNEAILGCQRANGKVRAYYQAYAFEGFEL